MFLFLSRMSARPYLWRQSSADVLVPYLWADVSGVERSGRVLVQRWLPARGRKYANQSQVQVQPVRQSGSWSDGGAEYHWLQRSVRQSGREASWKRGCCGNSGWNHHSLHSIYHCLPKTGQKDRVKVFSNWNIQFRIALCMYVYMYVHVHTFMLIC